MVRCLALTDALHDPICGKVQHPFRHEGYVFNVLAHLFAELPALLVIKEHVCDALCQDLYDDGPGNLVSRTRGQISSKWSFCKKKSMITSNCATSDSFRSVAMACMTTPTMQRLRRFSSTSSMKGRVTASSKCSFNRRVVISTRWCGSLAPFLPWSRIV